MSEMDASLLGNCNGERADPHTVCQATNSLNELKSIGMVSSDKQSGKCSHFNIRGYVAESRRCDGKIGWPFCTLYNNYNWEKHEELLPPMTVAEFRWWNCQNCLCKSEAENDQVNEVAVKGVCDGVKIKESCFVRKSNMASHSYPQKKQLVSGETLPEGRLIEIDCTLRSDKTKSHPSMCCRHGEQDLFMSKTTKEVMHTCRSGYDILKDNQVQMTNISRDGEITNEPYGKGDNTIEPKEAGHGVKENVALPRLSSYGAVDTMIEVHCDKNAPDADAGELGTGLSTSMNRIVHEFSRKDDGENVNCNSAKKGPHDSKVGYSSPRINNSSRKDSQTSDTVQQFKLDLTEVDEENVEPSKKNDLIENTDDYQQTDHLDGSKNLHHRKTQKIRMLNDIIKSEVLGMPKKVPAYIGDQATTQEGHNRVKLDALKEEHLHLDQKVNVAAKQKKGKMIENKKRLRLPEMEDEGSSLMHWLKKMPKKVKALKIDVESKFVDSADLNSKSERAVQSSELLNSRNFISEFSSCASIKENKRNSIQGKKQSTLPKVEIGKQGFLPQKQCTDGKSHFIVEDGGKELSSGSIGPKSPRDALRKRSLHPGLTLNDRQHKKACVSNTKSKISQSKDGGYSLSHATKDLVSTFKDEKMVCLGRCQKVSEKQTAQTTNEIADPEAVDGIPVEILKLLQENWHKRHLINTDSSTQNSEKLSEMTKDIKDRNPLNFTDRTAGEVSSASHNWPAENCPPITDHIGKEVSSGLCNLPAQNSPCITDSNGKQSSVLHKNQSRQNSQFNTLQSDMCAAAKSTGNVCHELKVGCHSNEKYRSCTDMSQQGQFPASMGFAEPSHSMEQPKVGLEIRHINCNGNLYPQRLVLQNIDPCDKYWTNSGQGSFRDYPLSQSSRLFSGTHFGMRDTSKITPNHYSMSMQSQDPLYKGKPKKKVQQTVPKALNPAICHLQNGKMNGSEKNKESLQANISCLDAVNGCNATMVRPLDLYGNDAISATNLLRLMDPAVCSRASSSSMHKSRSNYLKQPNLSLNYQHEQLLSSESRVGVGESYKDPVALENCTESHLPRSASKLCFPVPRIGVPGSLFMTDITAYSSNARTFSLDGGVQSFSLTRGKKDQKISNSASLSRICAQSSLSRSENPQEKVLSIQNCASQSKVFRRTEQMVQVGEKNTVEVVKQQYKSSTIGSCVINRNPADFTIPDENNEYMTGYDVGPGFSSFPERYYHTKQQVIYPDCQRQQKAMNLTALKGILRS